MRIIILDVYYPEVLSYLYKTNLTLKDLSYDKQLKKIMEFKFGTSDFWSKGLIECGHKVIDIIINNLYLQKQWINTGKQNFNDVFLNQIDYYKPDVIIFQNLSYVKPEDMIKFRQQNILLVGQISSAWVGDETIKLYDILFTSFPYYVAQIESLGVDAYYLPLAFDPSCFKGRKKEESGCCFVGGLGKYWVEPTRILKHVAEQIPHFDWYGYFVGDVPLELQKKHKGIAWGIDMYDIYARNKIIINRHGEVSHGYANNMRLYEATGMGSMLVTEDAPNLKDLFQPDKEIVTYSNKEELVKKIKYYLTHEKERRSIADSGQRKTFNDHTFKQRMKQVSQVLEQKLE